MAKKVRTTLSLSGEILQLAHEKGLNISRFLEQQLRSYLEGNGFQQPQPEQQTASQLEQPNQAPKELDLKSLFPEECIRKLQSLNFKIDNETLKEIIQDCLQKVIVELELYDPVELRYPTNTREYALKHAYA